MSQTDGRTIRQTCESVHFLEEHCVIHKASRFLTNTPGLPIYGVVLRFLIPIVKSAN